MLKIKTFRAIDDLASSLKFAQGHSDVLTSYGISKVSSSDAKWIESPNVYVIMVESEDGSEVFGGARIHLLGEDELLPIEEAIGIIDPKIYDVTRKYAFGKTGELCGLWNSKIMSGSGLSTILIRAGVAKSGIIIAQELKLDSIFALCAPWTLNTVIDVGYKVVTELGKEGNYPYPTDDLLATVVILEDLQNLESASSFSKDRIQNLRIEPVQVVKEISPKGNLFIEYNLLF